MVGHGSAGHPAAVGLAMVVHRQREMHANIRSGANGSLGLLRQT